jgi:site-specific recombinase XerD
VSLPDAENVLSTPIPALWNDTSEVVPETIRREGRAALFCWEEFFLGQARNLHTRTAYGHAVRRFLAWCESSGVGLTQVSPGLVGRYFDHHAGSPATKKQHLAAIRGLFDTLVRRHVVVLNPAASVRGERHAPQTGKTPEIGVESVRELLSSLDLSHPVGLRDRAMLGVLIYTAARRGAVARLRLKDLRHDGTQWALHFTEKNAKSKDIPIRHDLQEWILAYLASAELQPGEDGPLFLSASGKTARFTDSGLVGNDIYRMVKRRLRDAGLPRHLTTHSFRVTTITNLLEQDVPLEQVAYLAGHSDSRTTSLYDRRGKKVTRNIVERISI